ncbi:MAG: hypothetical protein Q8M98_05470 [Candidatus Cloacimonadaceae bacterium]|nr:hypothetical protein [Candidatus Cloacimonadaceae bacterium]
MDNELLWNEIGLSIKVDGIQYDICETSYWNNDRTEEYVKFSLFEGELLYRELNTPETTRMIFETMNPIMFKHTLMESIKKVFPNKDIEMWS